VFDGTVILLAGQHQLDADSEQQQRTGELQAWQRELSTMLTPTISSRPNQHWLSVAMSAARADPAAPV
jgi:hypothetical protein